MKKKIKCDIYIRVSTTMQVDGYSLDAQREKLKRYAEFQNMEIVNEYSDEGKSGKSVEGRPEFQRMLDNIENGTDKVQFVLVFKLSRFTFIRILIYDFHILKFRISFEFFFLSVQTVAIYLHGCGYSGIYIAFNLFILHNLPRSITLFYCPNLILVLVPTIFNTYFPY